MANSEADPAFRDITGVREEIAARYRNVRRVIPGRFRPRATLERQEKIRQGIFRGEEIDPGFERHRTT